jgi:PAS domain S-box-containing protein
MQDYATITQQEIIEYLHPIQEDIHNDWFERLERRFSGSASRKMTFLQTNRVAGEDLFNLLLNWMKQQIEPSPGTYQALFRKIRSLDYSISDFINEAFCLEQSLEHFLRSFTGLSDRQALDGMTLVRRMINEIIGHVLVECTRIFEYVAETSKCAFCQTDSDGLIVFANRAMEELVEERSLIGKSLSDYFKMEEQQSVQNAVTSGEAAEIGIHRLTVRSARGRQTIVGAEIGPVIIDNIYRGGYAHITDISLAEIQHHQLYDRCPLGIVNLNRRGDIVFANKSMLQMINMEDYRGVSVFDILPDDKAQQLVREQLDSRFEWKSDEYSLELMRAGDGARLPVMVSAFPQTDLSSSCVIGSYAILRSQVGRRMHYHIENNHDETELLNAVMKELALVIPYDFVSVSKYSSDRKFTCSIFSLDIATEHVWQRRWWKLTPGQIKWAEKDDAFLVKDLVAFFEQPDWSDMKGEIDLESFLKEGYCSSIFFPIIQDRRLVAAVSLMSKSDKTFKEHHLQLLNNLPIKSAVYMALYYNKRREKTMVTELIMKLTVEGNNLNRIASVIVASVSEYFKRQSVSIFKLNKRSSTIQFIDQAETEAKYMINTGYEQTIEEGVLGYVSQHRMVENIGDIQNDERFRKIYKNPLRGVTLRSELCIPIAFGGTLWLLNIEDEQIGAFSDEEEEELTRVHPETLFIENNTTIQLIYQEFFC